RTPRVDVTGSENPIMSKGEKDCFAEITFFVNGKIWKSSWKQAINRNGKLNPVKRMIADEKDEIHADQARTCDSKIIEILDRKSTRLNSSHVKISYAVFCLKKKKITHEK